MNNQNFQHVFKSQIYLKRVKIPKEFLGVEVTIEYFRHHINQCVSSEDNILKVRHDLSRNVFLQILAFQTLEKFNPYFQICFSPAKDCVLVFYCCITNYHKLRGLKQHSFLKYIFTGE